MVLTMILEMMMDSLINKQMSLQLLLQIAMGGQEIIYYMFHSRKAIMKINTVKEKNQNSRINPPTIWIIQMGNIPQQDMVVEASSSSSLKRWIIKIQKTTN